MSEHLAWAQWWANPWVLSHEGWRTGDTCPAINALYHCKGFVIHALTGIAPCLPPAPDPTLLRLVLASPQQLNQVLALIHGIFDPSAATQLSQGQKLWCTRLFKALPTALLSPEDDPLRLLHVWVDPATWQRLRLRFVRERVLELEKQDCAYDRLNSRLDTLWQAVVWRITAEINDNTHPDTTRKGS